MQATTPSGSNILVVSHEATRTGAVHSLLRFLEWLVESEKVSSRILCLEGGAILEAFRATGATVLAKPGKESALTSLLTDVDLILINSAASARSLPPLSQLGVPVIVFVHELNHEIGLLPESERQALSSIPDHYISCSEAVTKNLVVQLNIPPSKISTLGELVSVKQIRDKTLGGVTPATVRDQLGLSHDTPLFGGSGCPSWRKGTDLFLQTAAAVRKQWEIGERSTALPHFIWIGGGESPQDQVRYNFEIRRLGLDKMVTFVGSLDNPFPLMRALDVFCLTSREDPYPLVMIEAATLNVPIIGFAGSGGFDEFAEEFGGVLVDPADPGAMADAVLGVLSAPKKHNSSLGERLQRLDVETLAPKFFEIIKKLTEDGRSSAVHDAVTAVTELTREHYPVGVRVISDGVRKCDLQIPCIIGKDEWMELPGPSKNTKRQKVRLSFNAGPVKVCISEVVVAKDDGEKIIIPGTDITHSTGIVYRNSYFEASGHQSHLHIALPPEPLSGITVRITLLSDLNKPDTEARPNPKKRLLDLLGLRKPTR